MKSSVGSAFLALLLISSQAAALTNVSGTISTDTTWNLAGSPYIVTGDVTVASGVTLTIEAGVVVKFQYQDYVGYKRRLIVNGILDLQSTSAEPVVFTSERDDFYGGDSNGDGVATVPAAGNWGYIQINNGSNVIHNCIIRYGGYRYDDPYHNYMLWVNNCSPPATNCTFEYAYGTGLYYYADQWRSTSPQITNNTFSNCSGGIGYTGINTWILATPTITGNKVRNCSSALVLEKITQEATIHFNDLSNGTVSLTGDSSATINIENNWWGTIDQAEIEQKITHHFDDASRPWADYIPFLFGPVFPSDLPGSLIIYTAQAYNAGTGVLNLEGQVVDTLYGHVTAGTLLWSLCNWNNVEVANGKLTYNSTMGKWLGSKTLSPKLASGNYTVRYNAVTPQERTGSAVGQFAVGGATVIVAGSIKDSTSGSSLYQANVAMFDAVQLWALVNASYGGNVPPLATLLTQLTPIRGPALTDFYGRYAWADVPAGGSCAIVVAKNGYSGNHTPSFPLPTSTTTVTKDLFLTPTTEVTLAALSQTVGKVHSASLEVLNRNAETMAALSERVQADNLLANNQVRDLWHGFADGVGVVALLVDLGKIGDGFYHLRQLNKLDGVVGLTEATYDTAFTATMQGIFQNEARIINKLMGIVFVKPYLEENRDSIRQLAEQAGPVSAEEWKTLPNFSYALDALAAVYSNYLGAAGTVILRPGFSREKATYLAAQYEQILNSSTGQELVFLYPANASDGVWALALMDADGHYRDLSKMHAELVLLEETLTALSVAKDIITIVGAGPTSGGSIVAGTVIGVGLNVGKAFVGQAQRQVVVQMADAYANAYTVCAADNLTAPRLLSNYIDFLKEEAQDPYYFDPAHSFRAETILNLNLPNLPFTEVPFMWTWGVPGLDVAQGVATVGVENKGNVRSEFRVTTYGSWSPITLMGALGLGRKSIITSCEVEPDIGSLWLEPAQSVNLAMPFRGYSRNFLSQFKPHYLTVETYSGPWRMDPVTKQYYVIGLGENLWDFAGLIGLSEASSPMEELGVNRSTAESYYAAASSAEGRLSIQDVQDQASLSGQLAEARLSASEPNVSVQFTVEPNVYAADLQLFAPQDSNVAILITDSAGKRLGYSSSDGITYSELVGAITNMGQRPISVRLLVPFPVSEFRTLHVVQATLS